MIRLRWAETAVNDLESIYDYIAEDSDKYAQVLVEKIFDALELTVIFTQSGRIVPEMKNEMIREKNLLNHRVIYRIKAETIEVVRIIHSAKNLKNIPKYHDLV